MSHWNNNQNPGCCTVHTEYIPRYIVISIRVPVSVVAWRRPPNKDSAPSPSPIRVSKDSHFSFLLKLLSPLSRPFSNGELYPPAFIPFLPSSFIRTDDITHYFFPTGYDREEIVAIQALLLSLRTVWCMGLLLASNILPDLTISLSLHFCLLLF